MAALSRIVNALCGWASAAPGTENVQVRQALTHFASSPTALSQVLPGEVS